MRARDHFLEGYMKIIRSIETCKENINRLRSQKLQIEDELSDIIQQRSYLQTKQINMKREGNEIEATTEMTLNKELEQKKVELQ